MELQDQKQYREKLLEWCNNIYLYGEKMKPQFSNLIDLNRLDEWESSCSELQRKLQSDLEDVGIDDYNIAVNIFEQWELLYKESQRFKEDDEFVVNDLPMDNEFRIETPSLVDDLPEEWKELIQMANTLEIPPQEIRTILLGYSQ